MKNIFKIYQEFITIEKLFESIPVAVSLVDRTGRYLVLNQELSDITGMKKSALIGMRVSEISKEAGENIKRDFIYFDEGKTVPDHELLMNKKIYKVSVKPLRDHSGFAFSEIVSLTDITANKDIELKLSEAIKKLQHLASYDELTGILNMRTYCVLCEKMIDLARRERSVYSVLFLDLDHFKNVNDTYGHAVGDVVLKNVAECIQCNCRNSDIVGRVGGEEFSIFLPNTDRDAAIIFAENLRQKIENIKHECSDRIVKVTASIGVSVDNGEYKSLAEIQHEADSAMYEAKRAGRNRVSCLKTTPYN
ncbi:sensor domain-containing diguanylate cyclase [Anaeroarcus burkinensis]|uniref:sensor domain-containing diguanylate cyclase n=1 Tax=Anaeroarcus burkinensis TaxID=82376 RepID=UPI00041C8463|nr:GGDEF domain-containing protein [Anaeroarcus burkinensis]